MNWGHGIILSFICFGLIMFTMVFISMNQDVNLVASDYYKQEIEFQNQIDMQKNFQALHDKPEFAFNPDNNKCYLKFPDSTALSGKIHLFRSSDYKLDRVYTFDSHLVEIDAHDLNTGLWTARISWTSNNKDYYFEKSFFR